MSLKKSYRKTFTQEEMDRLKSGALSLVGDSFADYRAAIHPNLLTNWFTREMTAHLEKFYEDFKAAKNPRLVIQAPPQHGKSTFILDFISWVAGRHPNVRTIYTSFSDRLGQRANAALRRLYGSKVYQAIFPKIKLKGTQNNTFIEYAGFNGYFRNTTVGGAITGESMDLGIIDDPFKGREAANSETMRNKIWEWFTDDFQTRFSKEGALLIIMTRWHIDDLVGRLMELDPTIKVVSYSAIATKKELHRKKGEALFPEHKPLSLLKKVQKTMSAHSFAALYQQMPFLKEGDYFLPQNLVVVERTLPGYIQWVRAWDLAASKNGDYTVGVKIGRTRGGRYYITDIVRFREYAHIRDEKISEIAVQDGLATQILLPEDPGQAGKSQAHYLRYEHLLGFRVKTSPEVGSKVSRAEAFMSAVNSGQVYILKGAWHAALKEELRQFPHGKYDDQVDACSRAINYLISAKWPLYLA